jgi:uncharacterized spore protein YtfJ
MTQDVEGATEAVRRSIEGGRVDQFLERIAERVGARAGVQAVFGEPIERDGVTVIPVARVRWGFGGGAGTGVMASGNPTPEDAAAGGPMAGSGGGGGVIADPVGYLELGPDGAVYRPIIDPMPSPGFLLAAGATAALVLRGLARLLRG